MQNWFSVQFKKVVIRYKMIGYNVYILQQAVRMVVNPIMVDSFASLFICTTVDLSSD